jgi:protoporphyrinogen oxidase
MACRIVIVGGGIAGLSAAHALVGHGAQVTLLEASEQLGGLGTFFRSGDRWIDRFYHCVMPTDADLLALIDRVGLTDAMYWKPTRMGFFVEGRCHPFNGALDLLRFPVLSLPQRIRLGLGGLLMRSLGRGRDLDRVSMRDWLRPIFGGAVWSKIWEPMLRAKFGPHAADLPALYLWQRAGRESNVATRGYLRCGLKGLIDALAGAIARGGGTVRTSSGVHRMEETNAGMRLGLADGQTLECDWVIAAIPLPALREMTRDSNLAGRFRDPTLAYQGVVNALFFLSRPLDGYYWSPVLDSGTGFDGVVQMTALVDPAQYGDRHLAYVMKYCDRSSPLFAEPVEDIAERWQNEFLHLYKDLPLRHDEIVETHVFRAPFVEPVYPLGYTAMQPAVEVDSAPLLLATTAQVYPEITAWNSSVRLATQVVRRLCERAGLAPGEENGKQETGNRKLKTG